MSELLKPDRDMIAKALDHYLGAPGLLNLYVLPDKISACFETTPEGLERAADWVVDHDHEGVAGIYHRGTTLAAKVGTRERGDADNTHSWTSFRLDLDFGKPGFAPDAATVLEIARTAQLPDPSEWDNSGHGLYPVWHLTRPVPDSAEVRELGEHIHAEMARVFAERGYQIDKTTDAARVWRIPGTVNRKFEPVLATLHSNGGPVLAWGDLRADVPEPAVRTTASASQADLDPEGEPESLTAVHAENIVCQAVARLAELRPAGSKFRDQAYYLAKVTALQVRAEGGSRAEARDRALARFNDAHPGLVPDEHDLQWIEEGIAKAGPEKHPGWTLVGPRALNRQDPASSAEPTGDEELDELGQLVHRLRLRRQATRLLDAEERPPSAPPTSTTLRDLLAEEPAGSKYRIDKMWPAAGKILITAPKKSGKTTLIGNLLRCLTDGAPFLNSATFSGHQGFEVAPLDGRRIMLLDFEMTRDMLREWLVDQRIQNLDAVEVELMRGRTWDMRDDEERRRWASYLRQLNVGILLVDPIGPVLHGLGIEENSNSEVGALLTALDRLCREAGVNELACVHHAGHGADQRARGASAFLGWPDAIWELKRDTEDTANRRFLSAEGRDVFLPETALAYDWSTRRLALGTGGRIEARASGDAEIIAEIVRDSPGKTVNGLKQLARDSEIGTKAQRQQDAIAAARHAGLVHVHAGPNRALHHHPGRVCDQCSQGGEPSEPQ